MAPGLLVFIKQLSVFSGMLFLVYALFAVVMPEKYTSKAFWAFVPFFYLVALVSRIILTRLTAGNPKRFSVKYVRISTLRLLFYISVLLLYAFRFPGDAPAFIITFFVFYFAFSMFEIIFLYRDMRTGR